MKTLPCLAVLALALQAACAAAQDAGADLAKRFFDNKAWYGQVVVVVQGGGSKGDEYYRASYSIRREGEVTFKVKIQDAGSMSADQMEQMLEMGKGQMSAKELAEAKRVIEEMRSRRTWMTQTTKRKDEDFDAVRLLVNDRMDASGKEACGDPFDFRDTHTIEGTDTRRDECVDRLEIDAAKGTYRLQIDPRVDVLTLTRIITHAGGQPGDANRPPLKRTVLPGSATTLPSLVAKSRKLPDQGKILTGSEPIPKDSLPCWRPDYGTLEGTISWVISPEPFEEVELVLKPEEGYEDWRPEAGADEKTEGNRIAMKAVLRKKGGGAATETKMKRLVVRLSHVSREPGICINWPAKDGARTPDLMFDKAHNSATVDGEGTRLVKKDGEFVELPFEVSCYDGGAWGSVTAEAGLTDGRTVFAVLDGHPDQREVLVPKRKPGSVIADCWLEDRKQAGKKDDADDDAEPKGDGQAGDGLTNYEEYRGFRVNAVWKEGDPETKDFFVRNEAGGIAEPGITLFKDITHLEVHRLEAGELSPDRVVNFSRDTGPHVVDQHGIRIVNRTDFVGYCQAVRASGAGPGLPKDFSFVGLGNVTTDPIDLVANGGVTRSTYNAPTVAHELLHCCNVYHHGEEPDATSDGVIWTKKSDGIYEGDKKILVRNSKGVDITNLVTFQWNWFRREKLVNLKVWRGSSSGDVGCVMRYDDARAYTPQGAPDERVLLVTGDEAFGGGLCTTGKATGTNDNPGRFGPCAAGRGNCAGQIVVNDAAKATPR